MDQSLYSYSLIVALPLMLFFGFHLLLAQAPPKKDFSNFLLSRRTIGVALLILALNYTVHLFFGIRITNINATILLNLSTYFICYWLFSAAMMTLLDHRYVTKARFCRHTILWISFSVSSYIVSLLPSTGKIQDIGTSVLAAILMIYGILLSVQLLRTYTKSIKMFNNTHSDDIGAYIRWMSIFTYWAIGFGVSCGLLTFLPNEYVFLWILSSIPFYIYLYCCYQNYVLFYERVEKAFEEDLNTYVQEDDTDSPAENTDDGNTPAYYPDISRRIRAWMDNKGYLQPGITLNELSTQLCTNRTYLSDYINNVYKRNFRDWITDLRLEYAKRLMKQQPRQRIQEISEASGFLSSSHFTRTFSAKEGCSPVRWRNRIQVMQQ
ncbi:MAG: AraC family transcriptional regulator [Prevotella sp.]|nr:AraC family transcriptional regulator [Prevotella sp.]